MIVNIRLRSSYSESIAFMAKKRWAVIERMPTQMMNTPILRKSLRRDPRACTRDLLLYEKDAITSSLLSLRSSGQYRWETGVGATSRSSVTLDFHWKMWTMENLGKFTKTGDLINIRGMALFGDCSVVVFWGGKG